MLHIGGGDVGHFEGVTVALKNSFDFCNCLKINPNVYSNNFLKYRRISWLLHAQCSARILHCWSALLHKSAIGQGIPNPKKIYAAATVWGVPRAVN